MPRADWAYMKEIPFLIPPLWEQEKIAKILSAADCLIQNTQALITQKERYKKGLCQKLFSQKLRFKGFKDKWKETKLKEIFTEYTNLNLSSYPQYTIGKNGIKSYDNTRHNISNHKTFKLYDLIIGIGIEEININTTIDFGSCSPVYSIYKISINQLNPQFGHYYLKVGLKRIHNKITKKSTRREFESDKKEFLKQKIKLPSLKEQQKLLNF